MTSSKLRPYQPGWWLQKLILLYRRLLSPVLGRKCRYLPSCSEYAYESIEEHGALRGTVLAIRRNGGILGKLRVSEVTMEGALANPVTAFGEVKPQPGDELILDEIVQLAN